MQHYKEKKPYFSCSSCLEDKFKEKTTGISKFYKIFLLS